MITIKTFILIENRLRVWTCATVHPAVLMTSHPLWDQSAVKINWVYIYSITVTGRGLFLPPCCVCSWPWSTRRRWSSWRKTRGNSWRNWRSSMSRYEKIHQGRGLCLRLVGEISAPYSKCTAVKWPNGSIQDSYCHQVSLYCNNAAALSGVTPFMC